MPSDMFNIQAQRDLLRLRQRALKIALRLFEACTCQEEINVVSAWFEQGNISNEEKPILQAIEELTKLAHAKNIHVES